MPDPPPDSKPTASHLVTDEDLGAGEPKSAATSPEDVMGAPTEPALIGLTPGLPLAIKRATLMHATDAGDAAPSSHRLRNIESYVGFVVDGRYHIESVIAQGGMGVVYFARHRLIDKPVALKILRPELVHNREITARFLVEAQAASAIGSEHIVNVTDFGELPDGATYIVMEYLDGFSLNQRISRSAGPLPLPQVLSIARGIAEGLQRAHDANIVHRDLKPDNVLLIRKGKQEDFVKILDFGIAKVQSSQNQTTTAGRIFGTPHYMSPEQGRGDELDHRTDIYSLGVILYEMLTGHVPFDGENPLGILTQHMYVEVKPLASQCEPERITPALECVVARCLMKKPEHRYSSMAELDEDLRRLENLEPPLAWDYFKHADVVPDYLRPVLHLPGVQRRVTWPMLLLLSGMLLAGGAYWFAGELSSTPPPENRPSSEPNSAGTQAPTESMRTVNLAAEPIDTHVFRGQEDLGQIPILVQLRPGQKEQLVFRRKGYKPFSLIVDGAQPSYAIRLERLGSATPAPPPTQSIATAAAPPARARVVDLRASEPAAPWSPIVSPSPDGGVPAYFDELFKDGTEAPSTTEETPSHALDAVLLPPENMDPAVAPPPPGPPATMQHNSNTPFTPTTPRTPRRVKSPGNSSPSPAPPGPPPLND